MTVDKINKTKRSHNFIFIIL